MKTIALLLGIALSLLAQPASAAEPRLTIEPLADGVFAFLPTDEALDSWRAVSNSGAIVLDDGVLIFDSHWTPSHVEEAGALLRQHTDKPIRYVVNSHYHGDHTGGAWAYAKDVELITHHATRERLRTYFDEVAEQLPGAVERQAAQLETTTDEAERLRLENVLHNQRDLLARLEGGAAVPLPNLTFEAHVTLHRGRRVEIYFLGRGHTDGDAIVFLPQEKVAFCGDLLWNGGLPNIDDGYSEEWIATLEKILQLGATRFIPGHGPVSSADDVRALIAYLEWLRGAVAPYVRQGKGVDAAKEGIELPEQYAGYRFPWHFPRNIERVYAEIEDGR
ncbi:MAG: MBL fold metallo-hydrolase [Acidobacteriota bacterium]